MLFFYGICRLNGEKFQAARGVHQQKLQIFSLTPLASSLNENYTYPKIYNEIMAMALDSFNIFKMDSFRE